MMHLTEMTDMPKLSGSCNNVMFAECRENLSAASCSTLGLALFC